ncbi:MAG: hypothetical protein Q7U89_01905, partial [Coriobacteriia bacterium]|nr:hypothetical protein [Coriobacteriia bacterium]
HGLVRGQLDGERHTQSDAERAQLAYQAAVEHRKAMELVAMRTDNLITTLYHGRPNMTAAAFEAAIEFDARPPLGYESARGIRAAQEERR